jgi:hypothetical protein
LWPVPPRQCGGRLRRNLSAHCGHGEENWQVTPASRLGLLVNVWAEITDPAQFFDYSVH